MLSTSTKTTIRAHQYSTMERALIHIALADEKELSDAGAVARLCIFHCGSEAAKNELSHKLTEKHAAAISKNEPPVAERQVFKRDHNASLGSRCEEAPLFTESALTADIILEEPALVRVLAQVP